MRSCGIEVREKERQPSDGNGAEDPSDAANLGEEAAEEEALTDDECLEGARAHLYEYYYICLRVCVCVKISTLFVDMPRL